MMTGMWITGLLGIVSLLGLAYLVWTVAQKESGNLKIAGQIIAIVTLVLTLLVALNTLYVGINARGHTTGASMMNMGKSGKMDSKMMEKKMQDCMDKMQEMQKGMKKK